MVAVANDVSGGAYRQSQLGLGDIQMAGKTGTAQVRSYGTGSRKSNVWALKDHNLFVAFAPVDDPRYAVALIVEHGGKGGATAAAPRAREIMRTILLKDPEMRARIERPLPPAPVGPEPAAEEDFGAAPVEDEVIDTTPAPAPARALTATSGPRPYLAPPR